jgi:hypothetical protein
LQATLMPILSQPVATLILAWSVANAKALMAGEETFSVELGGQTFYQDTGKYHARSLRVLRQRYQSLEVADRGALSQRIAPTTKAHCLFRRCG